MLKTVTVSLGNISKICDDTECHSADPSCGFSHLKSANKFSHKNFLKFDSQGRPAIWEQSSLETSFQKMSVSDVLLHEVHARCAHDVRRHDTPDGGGRIKLPRPLNLKVQHVSWKHKDIQCFWDHDNQPQKSHFAVIRARQQTSDSHHTHPNAQKYSTITCKRKSSNSSNLPQFPQFERTRLDGCIPAALLPSTRAVTQPLPSTCDPSCAIPWPSVSPCQSFVLRPAIHQARSRSERQY